MHHLIAPQLVIAEVAGGGDGVVVVVGVVGAAVAADALHSLRRFVGLTHHLGFEKDEENNWVVA